MEEECFFRVYVLNDMSLFENQMGCWDTNNERGCGCGDTTTGRLAFVSLPLPASPKFRRGVFF